MKKIIKNLVLSFILFFSFTCFVNAEGIYDYLDSEDIIIGNTIFKTDTWISANRAAKAGALYAKNMEDTNVYTLLYIDEDLWFIYDEDEEEYTQLDQETIALVEEYLSLYYINNEPMLHTYNAYYEETEEEPITNDAYWFLDMYGSEYGVEFDDDEVTVDLDNGTITCPYEKEFDFTLDNGSVNGVGVCGLDDFYFYYVHNEPESVPLELESIVLSEEGENQDKVTELDSYSNKNKNIKITSPFDQTGNEWEDKTEISFDVEFNQNVYQWNLFQSGNVDYNVEPTSDSNVLRVTLNIDDTQNNSIRFAYIDNLSNTYEIFIINIEALDLPDFDLRISDISVSEIDGENNQGNVLDFDYTEESYNYNQNHYNYNYEALLSSKGDLLGYYLNERVGYGEWIALDLTFNEGVDLSRITTTENNNEFYMEAVDDVLRLYVRPNEGINLNFDYKYTKGNRHVHMYINQVNYDENNYIELNNGFISEYDVYSVNDDLFIEPSDVNRRSLYYDEDNNRLYFATDHNTFMFRDNNSLVGYRRGYDQELQEEAWESAEIVGVFYYSNMGGYNIVTDLNEVINDYSGETGILYYFFNRDLTNEETEALNEISNLDNINIVDYSENVYAQ